VNKHRFAIQKLDVDDTVLETRTLTIPATVMLLIANELGLADDSSFTVEMGKKMKRWLIRLAKVWEIRRLDLEGDTAKATAHADIDTAYDAENP
jgi:hypothetical protein